MKYNITKDEILHEVLHINPPVFVDERGWFKELYSLEEIGVEIGPFPLASYSRTIRMGSVRGLHYQEGEHAQGKLVACTRGSIFDVAVDIRVDSPTFGEWTKANLSEKNHSMIWIPPGYAHGFQTLEDDVEILYFSSNAYRPNSEKIITIHDDILGINWPLPVADMSKKDLEGVKLNDLLLSKVEFY